MIPRSKEAASIAGRLMAEEPALVVLAGPNGAGKTTFVATFLHSLDFPFVNADVIAKNHSKRTLSTPMVEDDTASAAGMTSSAILL